MKKTASAKLIPVDSIEHASLVVRSLRSASLSQQRYHRSAEGEETILHNLNSLDEIVQSQAAHLRQQKSLEARIEDMIAAPVHSSALDSKSTLDSEDNDEDEVRFSHSSFKSNTFFQEAKGSAESKKPWESNEADSSDEEEAKHEVKMINKPSKLRSRFPQEDMRQDDSDDEFLNGHIADDRELFKGFVAPRISEDNGGGGLERGKKLRSSSGRDSFSAGAAAASIEKAGRSTTSSHTQKPFSSHGAPSSADATSSSNSRVIVKPGQRIVVRARSRRSES